MFVNQVCSVVAIVGKNQDRPFLGEVFGATLRERDILLALRSARPPDLSESPIKVRRTGLLLQAYDPETFRFSILFPGLNPGVSLYEGVSCGSEFVCVGSPRITATTMII